MFEFRDVSKSFGGREALDRLNLTIPESVTTVLLGPSGCGKSTMLRLMLGLIAPDSGVVTFRGDAMNPESATAMRQQMGYVVQDGGLFAHLTAAGNAALLARWLGKPADWINARVSELAELSRFPADGLTRFPTQLSGGQRQRVGLIRALMLDPEVLLLDEPMGALDPLVRAELQTDLRAIFRRLQKTVVLVTHDIHEAFYFADEVVVLRDGSVVQRGSPSELVNRPADEFVERFIRVQSLPHIPNGKDSDRS